MLPHIAHPNDDIAALASCGEMVRLSLEGTGVTGSVDGLAALPNLRLVRLADTAVVRRHRPPAGCPTAP